MPCTVGNDPHSEASDGRLSHHSSCWRHRERKDDAECSAAPGYLPSDYTETSQRVSDLIRWLIIHEAMTDSTTFLASRPPQCYPTIGRPLDAQKYSPLPRTKPIFPFAQNRLSL